ncbi:MAG: MFS transporter [Chloroflexi bacterium]|nr:MFS transporter [Chloroflexota bacterium]
MTTPEDSSAFVPSKSPLRWLMLGLVWLLYASFGITSGTIAPLVGPIVDDLDMTYSQMGLVLGAWQLVYIVTAYPLGTLIDRLGVRRSLGIGVFVVWLSLVLRGVAGDFPTLFLAVALFGVGGPIISIGAPKVVSLWFEGNERGLAAGIYTTGPVTGMAIALATAASVVMPLTGTWRGISLVYGAVVLVIMLMWWIFARDVQSQPGAVGQTDSESVSLMKMLRILLRIRNVQIIVVLAVATFLLNHGLNNWLPTLLQERDMTMSQAGFWTAASTLAGAFGLLVIPALARNGYRAVTIAVLLLLASGTTVGLATLNDTSLIGVLILSSIVRVPMMPILTLILMETPGVGALRMGAAGGLFFAAAEIGGFGGPFLLGILRDATDSLTWGVLFLAVISAVLVLTLPLIREHRR